MSHSKKDRKFIERLANDLRTAHVDTWVDEWEIPPGISFRKKIFEEGLPDCDLGLVYLTPNSTESYWVKQELDAAFVRDAEDKGGFIALFVDSDRTRESLSAELQAIHCPVLSEQEYMRPFSQLISRAWECALKRKVAEANRDKDFELLEARQMVSSMKEELQDLDAQNAELRSASSEKIEKAIRYLRNTTYDVQDRTVSLDEVYREFASMFSTGVDEIDFDSALVRYLGLSQDQNCSIKDYTKYHVYQFIGNLIITGLILHKRSTEHRWVEIEGLTDLGIAVAFELNIGHPAAEVGA